MESITNSLERKESFSDWAVLDQQKLKELEKICGRFKLEMTTRQLLVNIGTQRLHLIESQKLICSYLVSTALNGTGQEEGTGKTPLGVHYIKTKIGDGAKPFEVFKERKSTGKIAIADVGDKLIVGRILWLEGVQPGFNQGEDSVGKVVDTYKRYIYIHGTNDIARIGKAVSSGCIRMKPEDVIALFEIVPEKTPVYIYQA